MADERNLVDEEDAVKENSTKNRREKKKREKKEKKEKKNAKGNAPEEDEDEKGGGRLILVLTTILIIAIWMGIIGILIKTDVGGFGSTVLYPLLKDVPYVNKILPQPEETVEQTEGTEHQYGSLSEAISQIKELEKELDEASSTNKNDKKKIKDLKAQIKDLSKYKEDEAAFEKEKEKYYEEVVFSDQAPDIQQYKTYYESIDPENAEVLYKQVVEQITYDSQVEDYAKTYSNTKEIIHLFSGGDYGIFCGAIVDRIVYGSSVLRIIIPDDRCNRSSYTDLGRSGGRMAVAGLYPVRCGRCTASVYRNSGTVSCQDISGSKEPSGIPVKGFQ